MGWWWNSFFLFVFLLPAGCAQSMWQLVIRLLYIFYVCLWLCVPPLITCTIITSRTLLPCDLLWSQLWMAGLSSGIVIMSKLAQLWVQDTEKQRQYRHNNIWLTEGGNTRREQLLMMPMYIYRVANQLRMASRRALKWIRMFEGSAGLIWNTRLVLKRTIFITYKTLNGHF